MTIVLLPSRRLHSIREASHPVFTLVGTGTGAIRNYAEAITVGKPGRCPEKPVLAIVLFDNSGSVTGGNDPIGQRFLEAYIAISRVGARCRCGKDLVAVLHFDTPTSGDLKPTPITKAHHAEISQSLAIPPDGAGVSLLGPSLTAARLIAEKYRRSHQVILIALTDFELFDDFLGQFIAFPGDVHAVALRATPPQLLIDAPTAVVTHIDHASHPGALARAVFTALTRTRPRARPLPVDALTATAM
jgi:hypothetical protein